MARRSWDDLAAGIRFGTLTPDAAPPTVAPMRASLAMLVALAGALPSSTVSGRIMLNPSVARIAARRSRP
jgi:hypothetical protein